MAQIDRDQFRDNFQYFDKEIVFEIIDIFINEYPDRIATISESIESMNFDDIKFNSHSIKGVIANFVAPAVEQTARELEMMGANKESGGIKEKFEIFKTTSAEMLEELIELKEEYK